MTTDAVIVDLDGTLCDTSDVIHLIEEAGFVEFQTAAVSCPPDPTVVEQMREQKSAGRAVLVVSSREFIWLDTTLDWLVEHDIPHDQVYLRVVGDYRKDVAVKAEIFDEIVADGYTVVEAWDDKKAVLDLWTQHGITTHLVANGT